MADLEDTSIFDVDASDDYEPVPKPKAKAAPKKATTAKPKAAKATTKAAPKSKKRPKPDSDDENADLPDDDAHDSSLLSTTPPKKQKKAAPRPKKAAGAPLAEINNDSYMVDDDDDEDDAPVSAKKTSATDQYQKLTQYEHILKRPDTYIGSIERTEQQMWVYNSETETMENRKVTYVPGLYKIFDEIIVNAADNKQRDKNMNELRVHVDREKGMISVRNNGRGIPIEIHGKERIHIPELIFGHLLVSSNYNDKEAKVTGGRNGYGAKLTNIYSTRFEIDTVDGKSKQRYRQTWRNNMSKMDKAIIDDYKKNDEYTKVTFYPDFAKFGMTEMDDDFEALVKRRVYDMAGTCTGVKVYLNGDRIKISKFKQYMEMYTKAISTENLADTGKAPEQVILTDTPHERWEIGFAVSDGSFQQVSFVNSIATTHGGTHVSYVADQIVDKLEEIVAKKNKGGVKLKKAQIKNHIFLFVNCLIENPAFTSQTKEQLTTKASAFGSRPQVSEKFLKDIAKTEAVNNIIHFAQQKADKILSKSDGNRRQRMNNTKLTDANKAGTKDGHKCTLILTEGDSAALLALAGRAEINPDLFGVFPLRGKLLNVRDAAIDQISKNEEIQNIKKFMGLQHKKDYEDTKSLRYGHLMIMTDQDHDGSHIKGLLINFLQVQFPSLLKLPGFLLEFITPIVKVWKGDLKKTKNKRDFFTMPEYEQWKQEPGNQKGWEHKYFKGLGTSDTTDAKMYFHDLDRHLKQFHTMQEHEPELIDLAFSKKKADARKTWLGNFVPGTYLDMSGSEHITYDDFINKELILFSMADNQRSIPSVLDGFKPGQRKVLYTCFRRNVKKDIKVVSLAGAVSDMTAYPYGETSLQQTIVGLAQNFVGSNNINCLEPSGNFGSRLQGGSDAASPRYIYTRLSPFARRIFHQTDEALLTYNTDDGHTIEPEYYVPVIPMILVNGADGIGTGWSTSIPNYNPEEIIANLKLRMHGTSKDDMKMMKPWFRGWSGECEEQGIDRYKFSGKITNSGECELEITELPVRMWTQDFKNKLEEWIRAEKAPSFIKDYTEYNTPESIHFIVKLTENKKHDCHDMAAMEDLLKLTRTMATSNLVAFNAQGRIHKYANVLDIMEEFYHVRMSMYQKRKQFMLNEMQRYLEKLTNQARFIQMIIDNKLIVSKKKKSVLVAELQSLNFARFPKVADAKKAGEAEDAEDDVMDVDEEVGANDFDYLLGMAIYALTQERVEKLNRQIGDQEAEIDVLIAKSPKDLWEADLDDLLEEWHVQLAEEAKLEKKIRGKGRRASAKLGIGGKAGKKRKNDSDDDSDAEYAVKKPKVTKAQPKSAMAGLLSLTSAPSKPSGVYPLVNGIEQKPVVPPPAAALDVLMEDAPSIKTSKPAVSRPKAAQSAATSKKSAASKAASTYDSDEDIFAAVAKESSKPVARTGRAAAQKTKSYMVKDESELDESFDDGNDMLEDVGAMVKGVGPGAGEGASRLFHPPSSKRPSTVDMLKQKQKKAAGADLHDSDTDWAALAQNSPQKAAHHSILSDDDDDDGDDVVKGDIPAVRKPTAAPKAVPKSKTTVSTATAKATKKLSKVDVAPASKTLSPAAKAYAARQARVNTAAPFDDDMDDDGLDDEVPAKPAARAPRRAVVAKAKKYRAISDDDDEDEDESAAFEMDDDSD